MAESQSMNAEESAKVDGTAGDNTQSQHIYVVELSTENVPSTPLFEATRVSGNNAPLWLRPFFSLRAQLTIAYFIILCIVVLILYMLYYEHTPPMYVGIIGTVTIILGTALAFFLNTLLLQPLWRVTDAAQAIASGDLKQRERLPLRLPPQDEIDRLAGSLNEMVTRLERAEEMHLASELRFRRFFSDASHQLRTPLTSLRGFTEVLMRGAKDDPEMSTRVLKLMKSEAERMTFLINDLLTLARLDDSRPTKKEYIDLLALATEEIEKTRLRAKDTCSISLSILTEKRLDMKGDPERIHQLFFVLLDNALKYGRSGPTGTIVVQLDREDENSVVRVIDNGEGIAHNDLAHIFDAFYRGQHKRPASTNSTNAIGTGLGLTIAVAVVRAHHGTISVYSEPDKGTTFTVKLPCVE